MVSAIWKFLMRRSTSCSVSLLPARWFDSSSGKISLSCQFCWFLGGWMFVEPSVMTRSGLCVEVHWAIRCGDFYVVWSCLSRKSSEWSDCVDVWVTWTFTEPSVVLVWWSMYKLTELSVVQMCGLCKRFPSHQLCCGLLCMEDHSQRVDWTLCCVLSAVAWLVDSSKVKCSDCTVGAGNVGLVKLMLFVCSWKSRACLLTVGIQSTFSEDYVTTLKGAKQLLIRKSHQYDEPNSWSWGR